MLGAIKRWWHGLHAWEYHNPYCRTCQRCGLREEKFAMNTRMDSSGWWEPMNRLTSHPCNERAAAQKGGA